MPVTWMLRRNLRRWWMAARKRLGSRGRQRDCTTTVYCSDKCHHVSYAAFEKTVTQTVLRLCNP